ncbi:MAG: hypothetical protein M3R27_04850 [Bacteroidota bacterium]|nr:hypothetical protein [Bacteroidota bacterium]
MKTITDYKSLPVNHKAEILWSKGEFIEAIEYRDYDVSLYAIDGLFVEMFYSVKDNQIEDIRVVEDNSRLKLYPIAAIRKVA